jgi:hypothetical protein
MLRCRTLLVAVLLAVVAAPLPAQTGPEWVQPSARTPEYWELVGRMFGDTSAVNDDRSLRLITDPAVIGLASIKATARPREVLARFAEITYNTTDDNQIDFAEPKLVVKEVREVRVLLAGKAGIAVEWRSGSSSFQHKQCIDGWIARTAFLIDARWRAIAACERAVVWSAWQRPLGPPLPLTTTHLVDGWTALDLTYDPAMDTVSVRLRKP